MLISVDLRLWDYPNGISWIAEPDSQVIFVRRLKITVNPVFSIQARLAFVFFQYGIYHIFGGDFTFTGKGLQLFLQQSPGIC